MMSIDFLASESPIRGHVGGKFAEAPNPGFNVVRFFKLMFVLTDEAKLVFVGLVDEQ